MYPFLKPWKTSGRVVEDTAGVRMSPEYTSLPERFRVFTDSRTYLQTGLMSPQLSSSAMTPRNRAAIVAIM